MGAGSSAAGVGGAGLYVPETATLPQLRPVEALRYEGLVKDWVIDDQQNYESVTSTEQGMTLAICVNQGQIKSSPEVGNTLDQIVYLGSTNLQADVEDRIRNANPAKSLIAAGKARINKIVVQSQKTRLMVQVFFETLDSPTPKKTDRTWQRQ